MKFENLTKAELKCLSLAELKKGLKDLKHSLEAEEHLLSGYEEEILTTFICDMIDMCNHRIAELKDAIAKVEYVIDKHPESKKMHKRCKGGYEYCGWNIYFDPRANRWNAEDPCKLRDLDAKALKNLRGYIDGYELERTTLYELYNSYENIEFAGHLTEYNTNNEEVRNELYYNEANGDMYRLIDEDNRVLQFLTNCGSRDTLDAVEYLQDCDMMIDSY